MAPAGNNHEAQYDENGDVILPGIENRSSRKEHVNNFSPSNKGIIDIQAVSSSVVTEVKNQYVSGAKEVLTASKGSISEMTNWFSAMISFLAQPVWIVKPNKKPKKYSRISLFITDVIRFGGTFTAIFAVLFVSLNYESFFQIVEGNLEPLAAVQENLDEQRQLDATLKDKLQLAPTLTTAGEAHGDILSFLPPVGPPSNRIIIPKLNLNVPIVTPPYQALLDENWDQVEKDIQTALEDGVVHYPGTARPGQAGNFFVTGHSSYYPWAPGIYKTVFARLHQLEVGDSYIVYYNGDRHHYIVRSKQEVKPTNVDVLRQPLDKRLSTLMTCSPVGTTLRRLILVAEEVDPLTNEPLHVGEQQERDASEIRTDVLPI